MRIVSASLQTHFGQSKRKFCFGWVIRRTLGVLELAPQGFTSHDRDFTAGGILFRSTANAAPTSFPFAIGVPNNALEAVLLFDGAAFVESDVELGKYDGARVELRIFDWGNPQWSGDALFGGTLGKPSFDSEQTTFELNSNSAVLNEEFGRVFGPRCPYPRYGRGNCANGADVGGLSDGPQIEDETKSATVCAVYSASHFKLSGGAVSALAAGWSSNGIVRFEGGDNEGGEWDVVKQAAALGGEVEIWLSLPALDLPQIGDAVSLERGCGRSPEDCIARDNYANYGGFPNFPQDEGMIREQ